MTAGSHSQGISWKAAATWIGSGLLLLIFPLIFSAIYVNFGCEILIYALFAISFNFLLGYAGLISFGHAAFFGLGGYSVALSLKYLGAIPLAFLPLIGAVSAALGSLVIGSFLTRVSGITFAMLTVAFSQLLAAIALKWHSVTGGDDGLSISRPDLTLPLIGRIDMFNPSHFYYVVLVLVAVSLWCCRYFLKTPMGNLVVCLRENEERTNFLGYHLPTARLILFIFTGFFAGLAGSLYVLLHEFISVQALGLDMSATPLLMAIIGGVGYFAGPIVGSVVFMFLSKYLSALTNYWLIALGFIFVFIVLFAPAGVIGFCRVCLIRIGRRSPL